MKKLAVKFIRLYQGIISVDPGLFGFSRSCRFYPSCSEYAIAAIEKYGFLKGGLKSVLRILKCGPWTKGGYDPSQ